MAAKIAPDESLSSVSRVDKADGEVSFDDVFLRKLLSPTGFYRERDKYTMLKKYHKDQPKNLQALKEAWKQHCDFQTKRRFKWPPKTILGTNVFWSWGYYKDFWQMSHACKLQGPDNSWQQVEIYADDPPDSSDEEALLVRAHRKSRKSQSYQTELDNLDWETVEKEYNKVKAMKRKSVAAPDDPTLRHTTNPAFAFFRNELNQVDFDALEAELFRRKSMGRGQLGRKSLNHDEEEITTTVTTEYIIVKDPKKGKKAKNQPKPEDHSTIGGLTTDESNRLIKAYSNAHDSSSASEPVVTTKTEVHTRKAQ